MWHIEEHRRIDKQLAAAPREILKRYEKWKDIAMISGPPGIRLITGFNDEGLSGKWGGLSVFPSWPAIPRHLPDGARSTTI